METKELIEQMLQHKKLLQDSLAALKDSHHAALQRVWLDEQIKKLDALLIMAGHQEPEVVSIACGCSYCRGMANG